MAYRKRTCRPTKYYSGGGGFDWKRTILFLAILIVAMSVISWIMSFIFPGGGGMLFLALLVIAYFLLPKTIRRIRLSHRDKASRKREPIGREELIDLD